jgi:hypothetical protein
MSLIQTITANPNAFMAQVSEQLDLDSYDLAELDFEHQDGVTIDGQTAFFRMAHSEGGGEGQGEHVERVIGVKVGSDEVFLRTTGFYESYSGTDWSGDWELVEPREVMVVKYFPVKA